MMPLQNRPCTPGKGYHYSETFGPLSFCWCWRCLFPDVPQPVWENYFPLNNQHQEIVHKTVLHLYIAP